MNLLEIKQLWVCFQKFAAVRNVSLAMKEGEFVALIGNSGSGKSSVANAILQLQQDAEYQGEIFFRRKELLALSPQELQKIRGSKIAMIFQEPMTSLNPLQKVGAQVFESLKLHTKNPSKEKVLELFSLVELADAERIYNSYPFMLSGGQRQRVMIAMALGGKPDLLIADEATTALDVTVQAQILKLLKVLQQKLGLAILFITHDLDIVRKMADRIYVMRGGIIISTKMPPKEEPLIHTFTKPEGPAVLSAQHLSISYGKFEAVKDISFNLHTAQTLGIIGESGSGKSSLAQALIRLIPSRGKIVFMGKDFLSLKGKELLSARRNIQMVLQDPSASLNPRLSIEQIVSEGLQIHEPDLSETEKFDRIKEIFKALDLRLDILERYPHEVSGGQKTRIALARVLLLYPKVLILDEVMASLDKNTQKQLTEILINLQKRLGLIYIFISHDIKLVRAISDYVLVMHNGICVEQNKAEELFTHPQEEYTKELLKAGLEEPSYPSSFKKQRYTGRKFKPHH